MLIVQRQHQRLDPIDHEMDFWMAEIEKFEREEEENKAREGLGTARQDRESIDIDQIDNADPNKLVFVPEDWMIG